MNVAIKNPPNAVTNHEELRHAMSVPSHDHRRVIAIDGPAAAGKTTVARKLANRIGATLFDTGALYRSVTLAALRSGVDPEDEARLTAITKTARIELRPPTVEDGRSVDVLLDGEDVTWAIRTPLVDAHVSDVSKHAGVRSELLELQRQIASGMPVVMVGRDIGTVVTPNAGVKIYLDASVEERARRRIAEMKERGLEIDEAAIFADLRERDRIDSSRALSPLGAADDAIRIDSDGKSIDQVVEEIGDIVQMVWSKPGYAL
jgi:cytidylate kinase